MKNLSLEEIAKFANRKYVKKIAVENFLMSMGLNYHFAQANMYKDARLYGWNKATIKAIDDGTKYACKHCKK